MTRSPLFPLLAITLLAAPLAGQGPWVVRPDGAAPRSGVKVEAAGAGWLVTSGPAAILYRPADRAAGNFRLTARLLLQPGSGAHQESFGIFLGGKDLAGSGQSYAYFLIRGDGTWKLKRRTGSETADLTPGWQASPAIAKARPKDAAANLLQVEGGKDRIRFLINGTEVWTGTRASLAVEGVAGIRLNHNLSVQIASFEVVPLTR